MATAVIIGAGPGIGAAVARRFAREGFAIGLIARSGETLVQTMSTLEPGTPLAAIPADSRNDELMRYVLATIEERLGPIEVLIYVRPGAERVDPDVIAERYWRLHRQRPERWSRELVSDEPAGVR